MGEGDNIVDFIERRFEHQLRPLARALYRLVGACKRLSNRWPDHPDLAEIRAELRAFDKEVQRDGGKDDVKQ
jgi:hypothetical protein